MASISAVAGVAAAAAYLDAKYSLSKDAKMLLVAREADRAIAKAESERRISLWYPFEANSKRMPPTEECIWTREGTVTWKAAYSSACKYAQFLLHHKVQPHDYVAFYLGNGVEFIFSMLATWAVGTAPALINYNLSGDGLVHCLKISRAKVILVDGDEDIRARMEAVKDRVEGELGMRMVVLDAAALAHIEQMPSARPPDALRNTIKQSSPAMLLYTSGTTGLPKASPYIIARPWRSGIARTQHKGLHPGPGKGRMYDPMPFYHGTGCVASMVCLTRGLTLCIGKKFRVSTFWDDIRDSRATAFIYVGETARYLMSAPPSPNDRNHSVKCIYGNGLRPDIFAPFMERFGIELVSEFFDSTEGVFTLMNNCRGPFLSSAVGHHGAIFRHNLKDKYIPVMVDPEDNSIVRDPKTGFAIRQPYDVGGEMVVAAESESVFSGYQDSPDATKKKFVRDLFKKGDLYYRSGDSLRRDADGRWYFLDRLGDTFRWKSENVSTAEVAIALGEFPGIVEANVYGVLLPKHDGRAGCAAVYIAPEARANFDFGGLHAHLKKTVPKYAVPVFLRLVDEMAPMHNNKQNKVPLRSEGVDPAKTAAGVGRRDVMMFARPGADTYSLFKASDWDALVNGRSKL